MANLKAALLRTIFDWHHSLLPSIVAPLPLLNVLTLGCTLRAATTFTKEPYQLPSIHPMRPLILSGFGALLLCFIALIPLIPFVVILTTLVEGGATSRVLLLLPLPYLIFASYLLPCILLRWEESKSFGFALALPSVLQTTMTANYFEALVKGYWAAILIVVFGFVLMLLTSITIIGPYLVLGWTLFTSQTALLSIVKDAMR